MEQILILKEPKGKIENSTDLFKKIQKIKIDYAQENFLLICLNTSNQVIKSEVLFKGGIDACLIEPRTLFRKALLVDSSKIIIAHNHPSRNLKPSQEDREIYEKLKEAGNVINLPVIDCIIFNKKEFYSLN